ncbi:bacteriohemerythrin [Brachyspira alvinipulli]|uniref:bacteriohemerythrin n=1 Tax=Brachyspira alvinipulli TaxID=84379 RepID=UPI0004802B5A|nr:bacteriohemerythrin [Brachyspira alvinipulli]
MDTENKNEVKWIRWENKYKTGYKRIDDQHKELVNIINDLYSIGVDGDFDNEEVKKSFSDILKRAIDYATYHFSYEEKIMSAIDYSASKDHITRHRAFSVKVVDEVNMYENGNKIVIEDFITFLRDWLINHIMVEDKKFILELKSCLAKMCENEMQ